MKRVLTLLGVLTAGVGLVSAQESHQHAGGTARLGKVHFPVSCAVQAQQPFKRALALLHSFEYEESAKAFQQAVAADPGCAMGHWGVAMTYYHPLWAPPDPKELAEGHAAIEKAAAAGPKTDRERAYVAALGAFYRDWRTQSHRSRALAYEKAMEELHRNFPDDAEAAIFYTLALNGTLDPTDKTYANQRKAGAILEPLFRQQPDHPGIAHYLIHSYDFPGLAAGALDAARRYAGIAPESPHALHMPSHIFTRLGLWEECRRSNIAAARAGRNYSRTHFPGAAWSEQLHAMDYLVYAYLQTGRDREAKGVLDELSTVSKAAPADFKAAHTFAASPVRYVLERGKFAEAAKLSLAPASFLWGRFPWAAAIVSFAQTIGAARSGDLQGARTNLEKLDVLASQVKERGQLDWQSATDTLRQAAQAWVEHAGGNDSEALRLARAAADLEDSTEKHPVTPGPVLPARELLADLLLELKQPQAALTEYEKSLGSAPNRFYALLGAARAARQAGQSQKARVHYAALLRVIGNSRDRAAETGEARAFVAGGR